MPPVKWTPEFEEYREAAAYVSAQQNRGNKPVILVVMILPFAVIAALITYPLLMSGQRRLAAVRLVDGLQYWIPLAGVFVLTLLYARLSRRVGRRGMIGVLVGVVAACAAAQASAVLVVGRLQQDWFVLLLPWVMFLWLAYSLFRQVAKGGIFRKLWDGEPAAREERTFSLREGGLQTDMALHTLLNRWAGILKVSETKSCLLLHTGTYGFTAVPKRAFPTPAAYDRFAQVARERAGRRTAFEVLAKPQAAGAPIPPVRQSRRRSLCCGGNLNRRTQIMADDPHGTQKFGIIGLEVMGKNIARNVERNGYPIAVYNRTTSKSEDFVKEHPDIDVKMGKTYEEFVGLLEKPRRILIMVKAGKPVDYVLDDLKPLLDKGDLVIDGGNSLYTDTERRAEEMEKLGFGFFGMGVSGGEEGALWGPSLMPGGTESLYKEVDEILKKVAAKAPEDGAPCVTYLGTGGAGHFVKMVHNGIEYGDMQLIAESYDLLKRVGGLSNAELGEVFAEWNKGKDLDSFLIDITADIFKYGEQGRG